MAEPPRTPRLTANSENDHAFYEIGPRRFEHFARALHEAQPGILGANLYAPDGQEQFGIDHVAFHRDESGTHLEVGQAKAEKRFGPDAVRKAADKFLSHWDTHWHDKRVRRFILFVGCTIKSRKAGDEIIAQTLRFAALGIDFLVWDSPAIYDRLPGAPAAVRTYLGQDWYERVFGKPAGPLSGLLRDLETGWDLSVLRVQAVVTRLNQAETAEIGELKRRARRGEGRRVAAELESALHSETAAILAPAVKADKLRLLAGLTMEADNHARIRQLLDEADALDGDSARLRAILLMETVGAAALLNHVAEDAPAELAEVRAVALLREARAREAFGALARFLDDPEPRAETLRLAALAKLISGDRETAVTLAERATQRDPDSRSCQQALAISVFHRALSPVVAAETGEWPQPIDQPLVMLSDAARADLERAEGMFRALMASPELEGHASMVMWHFGVLACMPWRHADVLARLAELQDSGTLPIPLIAWAISRALPFDRVAAGAQCDAKLATDAEDFETLLIRVALANATDETALARRTLDTHRDVLERAGHGALYAYWSAVLDLVARRKPAKDALDAHPWLRLRRAMDIDSRKRRAKAVAEVLEEQLAANGDARVILAATQLLLDAGWHKSAVKAAPFLVERIGTAEAIAAAAIAYFRSRRPKDVLAALTRIDAFPEAKLPVELERLRAECLAATGSLLHARDSSLAISRATGQPRDVWRSIQFQLAIGAAPKALALYEEHAEILTDPAPGHIALARAVLQSHPEAARRITRQIAADSPDDFVTAAFELANKLKMGAEQRALMARMQALGDAGKGGVILVAFDDVVKMITERREQEERAFEIYANGHTPVYFLSGIRASMISHIYLEPLLDPPSPGTARTILSARYGRRLEEDAWPAERSEIRLIMDATALLTAQGLGILDTVERAFAPIRIAPDAVAALLQARSELEVAQPERLEAARTLLRRESAGEIARASALPSADAFTVVWKAEDATTPDRLSLARLVELLGDALDEATIRDAHEHLGELAETRPVGPRPGTGCVLILEAGLAVSLEEAGLMSTLAARYRVGLEEIGGGMLAAQIAAAERSQRQVDAISQLLTRLNAGLEDGAYQSVAYGDDTDIDALRRGFMQVLTALQEDGGIAWIDDRYTSSIDSPHFRIATTAEILDALFRHGRLSERERDVLRQRLRAARWLFMPQRGGEIARHLRAATRDGEVVETIDLALLRRAIGEALVHRRRLQWPDPQAAAKGVRGEVPFLLDTGHAISEALVAIWRDDAWSVEDAEAASEWIIDMLEINLFPLQMLAAGDPRSDELLGVHLGSLVLVALQFFRGKEMRRQIAYLDWFWRHYLGNFLRIRPEIRPALETMLARHLERDEADGPDARVWRVYLANVLNAMPLALRASLLQRKDLRRSFGLPNHGQVTVDGEDYDEIEFFGAVIDATTSSAHRLRSASDKEAKIELVVEHGAEHVRMTVGRKKMRIDDWPRRVSSDDGDVRAAAIEEREAALDLSAAERVQLAADLAQEADRVARVRTVLAKSHESMQQDYADFELMVKDRRAFGLWELAPRNLGKAVRHVRLDGTIEQATARLLADRGLAIAIRRLGALPIIAPETLRQAVAVLDEAKLMALLDEAQLDTAPPWTQLFAAELVLAASQAEDLATRARELVERALYPEAAPFWQLYIALADFTAIEGVADNDWKSLSSAQQLAACWSHANALTEILVAGGIVIDSLLETLRSNRLISPRIVIEPTHKFEHDVADPRRMTPDRLRVHAAAPALFRLLKMSEHKEWAESVLRALVLQPSEQGTPEPRMEIVRGALAPDDALGSLVAAPLGQSFNTIHPGANSLFRDGLPRLLRDLLGANLDPNHVRAGWHILRDASGDAPLPEDLAALAREAAAGADLGFNVPDLLDARFALLTFTALAATNGWAEFADRIDAEAERLGPRAEEKDAMVLFEVAVWRARLAAEPVDRLRVLADRLLRLGLHPHLAEQAEVAARHFARNLSGMESEDLVDTLGLLFTRR